MTENKSSSNQLNQNTTSSLFDVLNEHVENRDMNVNTSSSLSLLSEEDQKKALQLANNLNVLDYENVLQFGVEAQAKLKHFTNNLLIHVQRNDTSPIRNVLFKLMEQLEKVNPDSLIEENKGFFAKLFKSPKTSIQEQVSNYKRLSIQIDRLSIQLLHAQKGLLADVNMLEELFRLNEEYFHNINIYISAGEIKRQELISQHLPVREKEASESNDPIKKQQLNDFKNAIEWLDKRIYDLQLSREITIQSAPQIRLIQQTNRMLVEKIQSSVLTTIPIWQTQIAMIVNINNQRKVNLVSHRLMDTSDEMMRKNAKMLEATAKDTKRHKRITHAEIDTFKQTQLQLLESIEESLRVQAVSNEQHSFIETKFGDLSSERNILSQK